jgi:hypothetical protein
LASVACLAAVGLTLAPDASAHRTRYAQFHLAGSHGYIIRVTGDSSIHRPAATSRRGRVAIEVAKSRFARTTYTVHGLVTRRRLRARFGELGRINVRFRPTTYPRPHRKAGVCSEGRFGTVGAFKGTVRFRGEHGYTAVRAHRVHGGGDGSHSFGCRGGIGHRTELSAHTARYGFQAVRLKRYPLTIFRAAAVERAGRVRIHRTAIALHSGDAGFSFDQRLRSADIGPGRPFSGSASYNVAGRKWSGDLSVSFPGEPNVALAGTAYRARLYRK